MNTLIAQDAATPPDDSTRLIPLTQGKLATVDAADYEWLNRWKWYAQLDKKRNRWYAKRSEWIAGKRRFFAMHRCISNAPIGVQVDHRDGNGLNNRRGNLRPATNQQNGCNRGPNSNNTSGHKGVSWYKRKNRWLAQIEIKVDGKRQIKYLGRFIEKADAAVAYAYAARKYHGDFARTEPFKAA